MTVVRRVRRRDETFVTEAQMREALSAAGTVAPPVAPTDARRPGGPHGFTAYHKDNAAILAASRARSISVPLATLRAKLGFPANATEAEIMSALAPRPRNSERDQAITAAVAAGKFSEARRGHYADLWDRDPAGTRHLLTASAERGGLAAALPAAASSGGYVDRSLSPDRMSHDQLRQAVGSVDPDELGVQQFVSRNFPGAAQAMGYPNWRSGLDGETRALAPASRINTYL